VTAFPILETERILLRELTLDDAPFYLRHFSDLDIVEHSAFEAPRDLEAAKGELLEYCIDLFQGGRGIRWGIVLKSTGGLIGTCGYYMWDHAAQKARIGYDLAPEHRRKGIMSEALREMIDHGFGAMELNRIEVLIDPRNVASLRLVEKLGFTQEGLSRESTFFRGRFLDDACYALLRREWALPSRDSSLGPSGSIHRRSDKVRARTSGSRSAPRGGRGTTRRKPARLPVEEDEEDPPARFRARSYG